MMDIDKMVNSFTEAMGNIGFSPLLYEECVGEEKATKENEEGRYSYLSNDNMIIVSYYPKENKVKLFAENYLSLDRDFDDFSAALFSVIIEKFDGGERKYQQVLSTIRWLECMEFPC